MGVKEKYSTYTAFDRILAQENLNFSEDHLPPSSVADSLRVHFPHVSHANDTHGDVVHV